MLLCILCICCLCILCMWSILSCYCRRRCAGESVTSPLPWQWPAQTSSERTTHPQETPHPCRISPPFSRGARGEGCPWLRCSQRTCRIIPLNITNQRQNNKHPLSSGPNDLAFWCLMFAVDVCWCGHTGNHQPNKCILMRIPFQPPKGLTSPCTIEWLKLEKIA